MRYVYMSLKILEAQNAVVVVQFIERSNLVKLPDNDSTDASYNGIGT